MRLRSCKRCGKPYKTDRPSTYLCPVCSAEAKRSAVVKDRICRQCGVSFPGGPRAWYCPTCRADRKREADRRHYKQGAKRAIGGIDKCIECGTEYVIRGSRQRYCASCADSAVKAIDRVSGRAYYNANRDTVSAHRKEMRTNRKICVICGAVFDSDLPTVTCSEACASERQRQWQRDAEQKRRPRRGRQKEDKNESHQREEILQAGHRRGGAG